MKTYISLILLITLNSACGVLKHSKNTTPSAQEAAGELDLKNLAAGPSAWTAENGAKYEVIAQVARNSVSAIIQDSNDNVMKVGTLRAKWSHETYPATFEGADPKPVSSEEWTDYPDIPVFFAQNTDRTGDILIVVMNKDADAIQNKSESTTVQYNNQIYCSQLIYAYTPTVILPCNSFGMCDDPLRSVRGAYEDFMKPGSLYSCRHKDRGPTKSDNFTNTSAVTAYEVLLKNTFARAASTLRFNASNK